MVRKNLNINDLALAVALGILPVAACTQAEVISEAKVERIALTKATDADVSHIGLNKLDEIAESGNITDARYEYDVNVSGLIPFVEINAATSWFAIQNVGNNFRLGKNPAINNRLAEIIQAETERAQMNGKALRLYYLENETKLKPVIEFVEPIVRRLVRIADNVSYQRSKELAIMTEHGLRPLVTVHKLKKDGEWITYCEFFYRAANQYEQIEFSSGDGNIDVDSPWNITVKRKNIRKKVMQDLLAPLSLRVGLGGIVVPVKVKDRKRIGIGYMWGDNRPYRVRLDFQAEGNHAIGITSMSGYMGIEMPTMITISFDKKGEVYITGIKESMTFKRDGVAAEFVSR
ncbi:TPA: hypothetical protein HA246_01590 [Candidatus Woesearchaeota archaeon]|nr:hypothetical protein [Candidatus Woesearchaeota archaeon]